MINQTQGCRLGSFGFNMKPKRRALHELSFLHFLNTSLEKIERTFILLQVLDENIESTLSRGLNPQAIIGDSNQELH